MTSSPTQSSPLPSSPFFPGTAASSSSSPISSTPFSFETTAFGSSAPSTATPSFVLTSAFRFPTTPPTFTLPSFGFGAAPSISSAVSNVPTAASASTTVTASTTYVATAAAPYSNTTAATSSSSSSSSSPFSTPTTSAFAFVTGSALPNTTASFTQTTAPASTSLSTTTSSTFSFGTPSSSTFGFGGATGPLSSPAPTNPAFSGFGRATGFASTVTTTCPVLSASTAPATTTSALTTSLLSIPAPTKPVFSGFASTCTTTTSASTSPFQFSFGTAASSSQLSSTPSSGLPLPLPHHSTNLFSGGSQQIHWNPNAVSNAAPAFTLPSSRAPTAAASTTVTASPGFVFCTPNLFGTPSFVASTTFAATAAAGLFSSMFPSTAASSSPLSTTTTSAFSCGTGSASTVTTTGPVLSAGTAPAATTSAVTMGLLSSRAPTKSMFSGFTSKCTTTTSASPAPALCSSQAATSADSTPSITTPKQETELAVLKVAYPDLCDSNRNKSEECFAADQIWVIYDYLDLMPRGYARINKVYSPFKVDLTWLEFVAGDLDETVWKRSGLPVACGRFKLSTTATTENILAFSHKSFWKRSIDKSYSIYPRKGETWALYKNWNIKWSSDPGNHREYEYKFVVVLSDYTNESGILVDHLVKLKGFVCLFKPTKNNGMASFQIPSNEMLRFSHRVPSFRTNGKERKDVPEGYFELDPRSLPSNLEEESGFIDMEAETVDCNINGSLKSVSKEKHPMPKERKNPDDESNLDGSSAGGNKSYWMAAATTTNAVLTGPLSRPAPANPVISGFGGATGFASTVTTTGQVRSASTAPATPATTTSAVTTGLLSSPAPTKPVFSGVRGATGGYTSTVTTTTPASPSPGLLSPQATTSAGSTPSSTTSKQEPDLVVLKVASPDFYNFIRNKSEECFVVNQRWAIFDDLDLKPRRYARINKVYSPFKVDVTWLEFIAGDKNENAWKKSGLPVACGKFKDEKTGTIEDIRKFSHKIFWGKCVNKSYNIYPRKGETWALYKNWNIGWSSDPDNHREYEYEFVVILSDYTYNSCILVAPLVKLKGFVCLFKPTHHNGMASFQILSNEMLRFSHRVPSFRTNGKERKDIPEGYFELDPCSLPSNLEEVFGVIDMEAGTVDCSINGSLKSVSKEKHPMPKKRKNPDAESTLDRISPGRIKSCRMPNGCFRNFNKEKQAAEASGRPLSTSKANIVSVGRENAAAHSKDLSPDGVISIPGSLEQEILTSPSSLKIFEMLNTEFCNFDQERSFQKFKSGQIWALYCKFDKLPKNYAQIVSVESLPVFKLAVKWFESCDPPRSIIPWVDKEMPVSCGKFKVTSDEVVMFNDSVSFSHQLSEVPDVNNVYTIYPRVGEVWALYSKFRFDLTCSDLKKCEYNIVEILDVDAHWIIVSVLQIVTGSKTVFRAKAKEGLDSTAAVPWIELYRFSHQVPNFMLSGSRYGELHGCWELDPRSLAVY